MLRGSADKVLGVLKHSPTPLPVSPPPAHLTYVHSPLRRACVQDVLRGAADEVLGVLKNKDMRDPDRQKGCEVSAWGLAYM